MGTRAPSQSDADWNSWRRWFITVKSLVLLPHESAHANQVSACSSRRWSATLAELVHGSARRLTWQNRSTNLLRHGALSFNDWEVSRSKTIWSTHRPAMRTASNTPATIHQEEICLALNFVGKEERPRAQQRREPGGVGAIPSLQPGVACCGRDGRTAPRNFIAACEQLRLLQCRGLLRSRNRKALNIQHPTSNAQHPPTNGPPLRHWMFDVGCWILDVRRSASLNSRTARACEPVRGEIAARHLNGVAHDQVTAAQGRVVPRLAGEDGETDQFVVPLRRGPHDRQISVAAQHDQLAAGQQDLSIAVTTLLPFPRAGPGLDAREDVFVQAIDVSLPKDRAGEFVL